LKKYTEFLVWLFHGGFKDAFSTAYIVVYIIERQHVCRDEMERALNEACWTHFTVLPQHSKKGPRITATNK
jgi:hypothetical protein